MNSKKQTTSRPSSSPVDAAHLESFLVRAPELSDLKGWELIELFVYYLTIEAGLDAATGSSVAACYRAARLPLHKSIAQRLTEGTQRRKGQRPLYVKTAGGYRLTRDEERRISAQVGRLQPVLPTRSSLDDLVDTVGQPEEKSFLHEAIVCFKNGAYRAAVIMTWIVVVDHLYQHVLDNHLDDFNNKLALVTNKKVRVKKVVIKDDFGDIPEGMFIELSRSSRAISGDVRKILDARLDTRNSAAHPSQIVIGKTKTLDFIEDLVTNVILKYPANP